ncbi:hypothetical protein [Thermococcus peptonophilus]|uniref:hypothetical protein n=1 Tax=Thermococcus peptonophilus TaxID=53952 RepID=UPI0006D0F232
MPRRKTVLALFLVATLSLSIVSLVAAATWGGLNEEKPIRIFGYDVYKFEGSGHYAIFYPMPDGTVKLLKTGKVGIFPTFVRVPRNAWLKEYANKRNTLKATPTPIVIFVSEKGLGIASIRGGSRVKLKELEILGGFRSYCHLNQLLPPQRLHPRRIPLLHSKRPNQQLDQNNCLKSCNR